MTLTVSGADGRPEVRGPPHQSTRLISARTVQRCGAKGAGRCCCACGGIIALLLGLWTVIFLLVKGYASHRRDCHLIIPPCNFIMCFNRDKQGGVIKMTVSPTARLRIRGRRMPR